MVVVGAEPYDKTVAEAGGDTNGAFVAVGDAGRDAGACGTAPLGYGDAMAFAGTGVADPSLATIFLDRGDFLVCFAAEDVAFARFETPPFEALRDEVSTRCERVAATMIPARAGMGLWERILGYWKGLRGGCLLVSVLGCLKAVPVL